MIEKHILLKAAGDLERFGRATAPAAHRGVIQQVIAGVPDEWLEPEPEEQRQDYVRYLLDRIEGPREWLQEAESARRRR